MNLDAIKKKLESMQKQPSSGGGSNNQTKRFKPQVGKQTVRVVPFKYNKEFPFTEMKFYYGIGSKKVIASPLNWGEKDPIAEFAKQLRGTNDKENWRLAKKLDPKVRIFAPVIVRGQESEGVHMWEFGKEIYMQLLGIAEDEDYGDYTDINEGRDFTVEAIKGDIGGRQGLKTSIRIKPKTTPLSADASQIGNFITEQPTLLELQRKNTYESIKETLQAWLSPEEPEEGAIIDDEDEVEAELEAAPVKNYALKTPATAKSSKAEKFDALFEDEE